MSEDARAKVRRATQQGGAAAVARTLDTSRSALLSYLAGTEREGTKHLIESRVERLDANEPKPAKGNAA